MKRFDSLVHVTRDGRWINGRDDAGIGRLRAELDRAHVTRACLVGLSGVVDNDYILESATADARLVPIAGINPSQYVGKDALADELAAIARAGFAGIKLHPRLHGYDPLGESCLDAIRIAAAHRLVVFLDTLFRQPRCATIHAADVVDRIAHTRSGASIVLLHGGGPALLEVADVARVHPQLVIDLSFTLMRYAGSSVDADIRWVIERLDQRVVVGSDMPEFTPADVFERAERFAEGLDPEKRANILHRNMDRLFGVRAAAPVG